METNEKRAAEPGAEQGKSEAERPKPCLVDLANADSFFQKIINFAPNEHRFPPAEVEAARQYLFDFEKIILVESEVFLKRQDGGTVHSFACDLISNFIGVCETLDDFWGSGAEPDAAEPAPERRALLLDAARILHKTAPLFLEAAGFDKIETVKALSLPMVRVQSRKPLGDSLETVQVLLRAAGEEYSVPDGYVPPDEKPPAAPVVFDAGAKSANTVADDDEALVAAAAQTDDPVKSEDAVRALAAQYKTAAPGDKEYMDGLILRGTGKVVAEHIAAGNPLFAPPNVPLEKWLIGKNDILLRLDLPDEKWNWLVGLSGCPIKANRGGKSVVKESELIPWYEKTLEAWGQAEEKEDNRAATTSFDLGHEKKPRKPPKTS